MDEQLPAKVDVVIVGTGLIESMLSAAASRVGKTVLHIDSNEYYGGQWASFDLKTLHNYPPTGKPTDSRTPEGVLPLGNHKYGIENFEALFHVPERDNNTSTIETPPSPLVNDDQVDTTQSIDKDTEEPELRIEESKKEIYTQESLLKASRKFNIDIIPKLNFARGDYVELLISSNIARYTEFRSVTRIATYLNGQLEIVPCSRSDVFANNKVSVIEKRLLMKLLTSLDNVDTTSSDKTFVQFLKENRLSDALIHYVTYGMSRCTINSSLAEGVANTKRFLKSLGRFGKTPFLYSMYGSGECPQAFCRLSAVFGGLFALFQDLQGLKVTDEKVNSLLTKDQEIEAEHFVVGFEHVPASMVETVKVTEYISRGIFITDRSIMTDESEHITYLLNPSEDGKQIISILEVGYLSGTVPNGLYAVHLIMKQNKNPKEDFMPIVDILFDRNGSEKPQILWSCYMSIPIVEDFPEHRLKNLYFCGGPDLDVDYDETIAKAKLLFHRMYPDLEFLPRAPDPEDIIFDDELTTQEDTDAVDLKPEIKEPNETNY